jgi:hypothetical protein
MIVNVVDPLLYEQPFVVWMKTEMGRRRMWFVYECK